VALPLGEADLRARARWRSRTPQDHGRCRRAGLSGQPAITPFLGAEFIPSLDEGAIAMQIWRCRRISLEQSNAHLAPSREGDCSRSSLTRSTPSSRDRARRDRDRSDGGRDQRHLHHAEPPRSGGSTARRSSSRRSKRAVTNVPGAIFSFSQPIELRVSELISGVRSDVAVQIYGDDLAMLKKKADEVVRAPPEGAGRGEVKAEQTTGLPVLRMRIDRRADRAATASTPRRSSTWSRPWGASVAGTVLEGQTRFRCSRCASAGGARRASSASGTCALPAPPRAAARRLVPLSQLAEIDHRRRPGADQPR
jgi:cobalt-zinc-cadmium resistance protein CzcA